MARIVLSTLNARYTHCAFGLRYLYANLKELQGNAKLIEFTISQNTRDIAEAILAEAPEVVGFGVYIWNTRQTEDVVSILKRVNPKIKIVLGGPEVSFETAIQSICKISDLTIQGEADILFYQVCKNYFEKAEWPSQKWIAGELPNIHELKSPYSYYSDSDIKNRVIYVEASRGCPYKCEYCLSSLDKTVRSFEIDLFLCEMAELIRRGVRQFKFIDRTFNLSIQTSSKILQFFLDQMDLGLFLHFEMVPDRLPSELRDLIAKFPKGALQFEIGIQTWDPHVSKLVSRRQDYTKIKENFSYLSQIGTVHTHADLIAGLPSETLESFAHGFDELAKLSPDEIQVGILKRLKGTPIIRHDEEWCMTYQEQPPFQVLQTKTMSYQTLQNISRFSHFWDLVANSGNFKRSFVLIKELAESRAKPSLYFEFEALTAFLSHRHPEGHGVSLLNLVESIWIYFKENPKIDLERARNLLIDDYSISQKRDIPKFLRIQVAQVEGNWVKQKKSKETATPSRQMRHLLPT